LAGIPSEVLALANQHLQHVQQQEPKDKPNPAPRSNSAVLRELAAIEADNLSAREALELIYRLKALEALSSTEQLC
jgi:DNA mismatch repair protein MutS